MNRKLTPRRAISCLTVGVVGLSALSVTSLISSRHQSQFQKLRENQPIQMQKSPEKVMAHTTQTPTVIEDDRYITDADALKLYRDIEKFALKKAHQGHGKSLRFYSFESHYDPNAQFYTRAIMHLIITHKLGVKHLLLEVAPKAVKDVNADVKSRGITNPTDDDLARDFSAPNPASYFAEGIRDHYIIGGIESDYKDDEERSYTSREKIAEKLFRQKIKQKFPHITEDSGVKVIAKRPKVRGLQKNGYAYPMSTHFSPKFLAIAYYGRPQNAEKPYTPKEEERAQKQHQELTDMAQAVYKETNGILFLQREAQMGKHIKNIRYPILVAAVGSLHAETVITNAHNPNAEDIVFSASDVEPLIKQDPSEAVTTGYPTRQHLEWVRNPHHATQYPKNQKPFNPVGISQKIERVLKMADDEDRRRQSSNHEMQP